MKLQRLGLGVVVASCFGAAVVFGINNQPPADQMTQAAEKLLENLSPELRQQASFDFDDPERLNWHYIPRPRKGAVLKAMTNEQQELTKALLKTGTSKEGLKTALDVMALEGILRDIESKARKDGPVRDPLLYYVSIFGKPSATGKWGWRIEGHHLSINYAIEDGKVVGETPIFFGANPAKVPSGPKEGLRILPAEEDMARQIYTSLEGEARKKATIAEKAPNDVLSGAQNAAPAALPVEGLAYSEMADAQKKVLTDLLKLYTGRFPPEIGEQMFREVTDAGLDKIHFGWSGPSEPGQPHAYRIQGPTFVMEYNNTQGGANHSHSLWRSYKGDFGIPLAAK